jgi:FkbM family methyltransferase
MTDASWAERSAWLRAVQVRFPYLRPAKFAVLNAATRMLGRPMIPEFRLLARLGPVGLALDIGANWGQSLEALKRTVRPREIVCFEPAGYLASRLRRRFAHDPSVRIEAVALGDAEGSFKLHTPHYRKYVFDGLASLDPDEAMHWLGPRRLKGFDPRKLTLHSETVPVRRLDDYALSPEVVKIDVQGAELAVVRGGIETFRRMRPACVIETPGEELVALLGSLGLHAYRFDGASLRPDNWASGPDVLFLSDEHRRIIGL